MPGSSRLSQVVLWRVAEQSQDPPGCAHTPRPGSRSPPCEPPSASRGAARQNVIAPGRYAARLRAARVHLRPGPGLKDRHRAENRRGGGSILKTYSSAWSDCASASVWCSAALSCCPLDANRTLRTVCSFAVRTKFVLAKTARCSFHLGAHMAGDVHVSLLPCAFVIETRRVLTHAPRDARAHRAAVTRPRSSIPST